MKPLLFLFVIWLPLYSLNALSDETVLTDAQNKEIEAFDEIDWKVAFERMKRVSPMGYHPFLMPLIMRNRDFIELDDDQIRAFRKWSKKYRIKLLHTMDKIIYERNRFHKLSLNPHTSEEVLRTKQQEIFRLQQKVLEYQFSCRRNILDTFNEEQWDNFRFVLNENGFETD